MGAADLGALRVLLVDPHSSAVLMDFDGTLAPIVPAPGDAKPLPDAVEVLARLSARFGVVGVVSGRPAEFLARHLGGSGPAVRLVGVYGCEWVENGEVRRAPEVRPWIGPVAEVLAAARAEAPAGVGIEQKGVSVTLHWRLAPEAAKWASVFAATWADRTGLVLQPGRMAIEFRPPVDLDKGRVVERLAQGCTAACFAGDDAGDLAAFEALDRLAARGVRTVRVAVADDESPPELGASADLVLPGPAEALAVLRQLASAAGA
ncbi:MAG: trehalose-phosphatase [Acidimicrobiales bacterium]|jgi:trehalose 6-phosphate phosphatase